MQNYYEAPESIEARAIMRLVALGSTTIEGARELIAIPGRQERVLRLFVAVAGKEGSSVGYAIAFRRKVMAEFEKLVAENQLGNSAVV
jgi:hypothetical protein